MNLDFESGPKLHQKSRSNTILDQNLDPRVESTHGGLSNSVNDNKWGNIVLNFSINRWKWRSALRFYWLSSFDGISKIGANYELTLIFWSEEAVANRFPNASNWISKIKSFASSPSRICSDFWDDIVWTILNSSKSWNQTWRNEGVYFWEQGSEDRQTNHRPGRIIEGLRNKSRRWILKTTN